MEVIDRVEEEVGCVEELAKWAEMKACSPGEFFSFSFFLLFFFCFPHYFTNPNLNPNLNSNL
jgi:hypothetical protein